MKLYGFSSAFEQRWRPQQFAWGRWRHPGPWAAKMERASEFRFAGFDALPCFTVWGLAPWVMPLLAALPPGFFWFGICGGSLVLALALLTRVRVMVSDEEVRVTKTCAGIPYWWGRAEHITSVWYGGDWGMEHGAIGVVMELNDGREVHVGSPRSMRFLFAALTPLSRGRERQGDALR